MIDMKKVHKTNGPDSLCYFKVFPVNDPGFHDLSILCSSQNSFVSLCYFKVAQNY